MDALKNQRAVGGNPAGGHSARPVDLSPADDAFSGSSEDISPGHKKSRRLAASGVPEKSKWCAREDSNLHRVAPTRT